MTTVALKVGDVFEKMGSSLSMDVCRLVELIGEGWGLR